MKVTVEQLQQELEKQGLMDLVEKHRGAEEVPHLLNRFLVARKHKLKDAMKMIRQDLEWRETEKVLEIRNRTSREVLNAEINPQGKQLHDELFPHGFLGTCRMGRPVLYLRFGRDFDAEKLDKNAHLTHEDLARYNIWMMERVAAKMNFEGQWVVVVDLEGWHLGQMTIRNMKYVKQFADKNSLHYPERAGKIFLINVPSVFSKCWSLMKPWLDDVTREKIGLYRSPEQWIPAISELMDLSMLPKRVGGNANLEYDSHSLDPSDSEYRTVTA
ncbi:hypothetical protein GUITHDRAFT_112715 [Guillardia theta CCMP2712]|uniref:CRAL-TRIO domain-containing protein n=1 Tax=Guillardia theta (strain CCMP2712) TaxID=905079 RepID=L1IYT2_GUITC|nr:hypothetical protein GUITHDRAFT_112715 [Guillardia theta CCMP2712]EKX41247.1 hypothetical protein GUITHDRAFT_112715 [Guillardia theta CCMP2712]|eukprot:XP_005828227.1 hypothetical protein GUITHDRAFT_112715 [Guillardia theta CCMP2712]